MHPGKTIFSQIMNHAEKHRFDVIVNKYKGNFKTHKFSCWDQFLCMSFAQLTYRNSLRDIKACLTAQSNKLYHMGILGNPSCNNLAKANQNRDWRIYADFAQVLIFCARKLYRDDNPFSVDLDNTVYALDFTTIDLCLSLFPWVKFRTTKGAIKLHSLLDLRGSIPSCIIITDGSVHDVNILDELITEPGSFYIMDRGYIDFIRLYRIHKSFSYFVIRAKSNFAYKRLYSSIIDRTSGLRSDQIIVTSGINSKGNYPEKLRRIRYYDNETGKYFVFITNNFEIPALLVVVTPLQIEHYITLAMEESYKIGVKPVNEEIIKSVISKSINDLEPRITRYGYNVKTLSNVLNIRPSVIKSLFHGQLSPTQTHEIQNEILALGISL